MSVRRFRFRVGRHAWFAIGVVVLGWPFAIGLGGIRMPASTSVRDMGKATSASPATLRPDSAPSTADFAPSAPVISPAVAPPTDPPLAIAGESLSRTRPAAPRSTPSAPVEEDALSQAVVGAQSPSPDTAALPSSAAKAVVIVGPSGRLTSDNLKAAEEFAALAAANGMDVRRVFHPHATWSAVLAEIQGAKLVAYFGHGNSWPSPYGPFQERTKDGFGLDTRDGASADEVTYFGADAIRREIVLAPNAIVVLNHLCYASGNGEPGMAIPDWTTAWQRVDNYASGFLSVGAGAVFAYGTGSINPILDALFTTDQTMDEIFMTPGARPQPYYGFTGWDDRYYDSARRPGLRNHLDPGANEGYLRALTGELTMTAHEWLSGD